MLSKIIVFFDTHSVRNFFFVLTHSAAAAAAAALLQSCPTLCDSIEGSPPGSLVPGILQPTGVGCHFLVQRMKVKSESEVASRFRLFATPWTVAHQAPPSMGFSRQEYWSGVPLTHTILCKRWNFIILAMCSVNFNTN